METSSRKAKRVILDGPLVTIEWEDGAADLERHPNVHEARIAAAQTAGRLGTFVHDTAKQEALSFLS